MKKFEKNEYSEKESFIKVIKKLNKNKKFLSGVFGTVFLVIFFIFIYILAESKIIPFLSMNGESFNLLRLFTANFYHNSLNHLENDVGAVIILGFPFFHKFKVIKGVIMYSLIGFLGNLVSSIFFIIISLILSLYGSKGCIFLEGAGSSGSSTGMGIITIILIVKLVNNKKVEKFAKEYLNEDKIKKYDIIFIKIFLIGIITLLIYVLIIALLTDIYLTSTLLNEKFLILKTQGGILYEISRGTYILLNSSFKNNQGTPFLIHTWCILIGILLYKIDQFILRQKAQKIL